MKKSILLLTAIVTSVTSAQAYVVTVINHTGTDIVAQGFSYDGTSKQITVRSNATGTVSLSGCPTSVTITDPGTFARLPVSLYYLAGTECSDKQIDVYEATGLVKNTGTSASGALYTTGGFRNVACFKVSTNPPARNVNNTSAEVMSEFISQGAR